MSGKNWILLVAGSKDWANYKHQANVCLHYQILKNHPNEPIPDEQIVVMMYDDIARNPINPCNGEIVSVVDKSNVYSGVPIDYTGEDVTPENFLAALRGDTITGKKVIDSGPNDNIFVYMCGVEQEQFPFQFLERTLSPDKLIETLKSMHDNCKFSKMVIYMDSSYSETMFKDLPEDINVFALTSCSKYIETTPTDYDGPRGVFLSNKFSSAWLKMILNTVDFTTTTFHDLIERAQPKYRLKQNCDPANPDEKPPCPCAFGDREITKCFLSEFLQQ
ncbi:hypothetical protein PO909_033023 [Leuciscus waleckii]